MSAVDTDPEVKKDIERLSEAMRNQVKDASDITKSTLYFYMCKYHYYEILTEIQEKKYRDIMIIPFPKAKIPILPEVECKIMDLIEKFKSAPNANLKAPYYAAAKDICHRVDRGTI